jgi:hypothetical protein
MLEQAFYWVMLALFSGGFLAYGYCVVTGRPIFDDAAKDASPSVVRLRALLWTSLCLWLAVRAVRRLFPDALPDGVLVGVFGLAAIGVVVGVAARVWLRVRAGRSVDRVG